MPILSAEERVGRTLDGKYEIGAPIATGGMGVVYRGKHTWTGRDVAIKVLQPGLSLDPDISRRFLTEARASATLRHPNVVDVLDMGRDEDGTLYMVLELLEGRDLDELLAERGVLAPEEAIPAIAPILDALAFAHEKGFVHRDIKPSNIYLATDARGVVIPKILDFGIAKALDGGANKATRTGVIIGTPHYMAPEQASGVGVIGPATDTWAIGVLLFQALTGTVPFDGASPTMILMNVLGKRARPVCEVSPSVPARLGALVDAMLDPDPDARPADLRELAEGAARAPAQRRRRERGARGARPGGRAARARVVGGDPARHDDGPVRHRAGGAPRARPVAAEPGARARRLPPAVGRAGGRPRRRRDGRRGRLVALPTWAGARAAPGDRAGVRERRRSPDTAERTDSSVARHRRAPGHAPAHDARGRPRGPARSRPGTFEPAQAAGFLGRAGACRGPRGGVSSPRGARGVVFPTRGDGGATSCSPGARHPATADRLRLDPIALTVTASC